VENHVREKPVAGFESGTRLLDHPLAQPALLVLVVLCSFYPVLSADFTNFDDGLFLYENELTKDSSPAGIARIFKTNTGPNYVPLVILSFTIERAIWGLRPEFYHAVNLLLHAGSALLVFHLLKRLCCGGIPALAAAIIWAVHPMRAESVAWVTERKDCLCAFFYFSAIAFYLRFRNEKKNRFYILTLFAHALALLSKGMAVMLPLTLLLLDWHQQRRDWKRAIIEKLPMFLLAALCAYPTLAAHVETGTAESFGSAPGRRASLMAYSLWFHLGKQALPLRLCPAYYVPEPVSPLAPAYFVCLVSTAALAALLWTFRASRMLVLGAAFYLIAFLPASQIVPLKYPVADRYTCLPSFGLVLLLCAAAGRIREFDIGRGMMTLPIAACIVTVILSQATARQCALWRDSLTLWSDAERKLPDSPAVLLCLGNYWNTAGEPEKAMPYIMRGLQKSPEEANLIREAAVAFLQLGNIRQAYEMISKTPPGDFDDKQGMEIMGVCLIELGNIEEGGRIFRGLQARFPDAASVWQLNGIALLNAGYPAEAMPLLQKALELSPRNPDILDQIRRAESMTGLP